MKTCPVCRKEVALKALSIFHLAENGLVYCPYCGSKLKLDLEMLRLKVNELKKEKDRSYLLSKYVLSATLALAGLWFIDISMSGELERMYSYLPANVFHAGMRSMLFFFTTSSLILSIVFWIQGMVYSYKISKIIST